MKSLLILLPVLALTSAIDEGLPPIDADIEQCRALIAERKGLKHQPTKKELYRVGNAAGLLCDTFTDEEWEETYGHSEHD